MELTIPSTRSLDEPSERLTAELTVSTIER